MKSKTFVLGAVTLAFGMLSFSAASQTRYFSFVTPNSPNSSGPGPRSTFGPHEFVFATSNQVLIERIRAIINSNDQGRDVHIMGKVVRGRVEYNEEYPFYLDEKSIQLFSNTTEQCSATAFEVEEHIEKVGVPDAGFLQDGIWCPWDSRLVREIDRRSVN